MSRPFAHPDLPTRDYSDADVDALCVRLEQFMARHVYPVEEQLLAAFDTSGTAWRPPALLDDLKARAKEQGLWNLFITRDLAAGQGLTNQQYGRLCEIMGRVLWAPEVFNCSAPDTGNIELLLKYGSADQQAQWLPGLLDGSARSAFCMTEPAVASSDATNIETCIERIDDRCIVTGRKWFASGALNVRATLFLVMGKSDKDAPRHQQQSIVLVPRNTPGLVIERPLPVFTGLDEHFGGHAEICFNDVELPASAIVLGEGRGFEIAQGRLGPGRVHHCMRLLGLAERALEAMCARATGRMAFGRLLADRDTVRADIARSRAEIEQARLLVMNAAAVIDRLGAKAARREIALIKFVVPGTVAAIIDRAIQVHGAAGVTNDHFLARAWIYARAVRIADGPDEVHRETIARQELLDQASRAHAMVSAAA